MMILDQGHIFQGAGTGKHYPPPLLATLNKTEPWGLHLRQIPATEEAVPKQPINDTYPLQTIHWENKSLKEYVMPTKVTFFRKIITYLVIKCDQSGISCGHWKSNLFHFRIHLWYAATVCCQQHSYFHNVNAVGVVAVSSELYM